jgi:cysteine desulfurase / selenocysteine lyase
MDLPLHEKYAGDFPVAQRMVYLNHAAVSPLCRRAAEAMKWLADDCLEHGSLHYDRWMAVYDGLRQATGRLVNGRPENVAIVKNTSEGIATVAIGFDWRPGDRMVAFREEFPANYYPWKRLEEKGVHVEWLSCLDPLERIGEASRGARMLAISFVQFLSGYRAPVQEIGEICRRNCCFLLVDAIQGLGAYPIDAEGWGIAALAADGHKWLTGPEGCGILYINEELRSHVEPVEFGWTNVAKYADYASRDMALRPDAGRYECGTLNTIGCFGLHAAIEFLLDIGLAKITPALDKLSDRIARGAARKGYELAAGREPGTTSAIVSFRKPGVDARMIVHDLKANGILAAPRAGWVRTSPHFYVDPDGIDRMLDLLP